MLHSNFLKMRHIRNINYKLHKIIAINEHCSLIHHILSIFIYCPKYLILWREKSVTIKRLGQLFGDARQQRAKVKLPAETSKNYFLWRAQAVFTSAKYIPKCRKKSIWHLANDFLGSLEINFPSLSLLLLLKTTMLLF